VSSMSILDVIQNYCFGKSRSLMLCVSERNCGVKGEPVVYIAECQLHVEVL
jgi:hypothetical protein